MAAVLTLPYAGELCAVREPLEHWAVPPDFEFFPDTDPPVAIQNLVDYYNRLFDRGGEQAVFVRLPEVEPADNGLSFSRFGEPSKVLVLVQNPFATDLSPHNRFRGQFLYDSLKAMNVVGPDDLTPQVLQVASACRKANMPLTPHEHLELAHGHIETIADKVAELIFKYFSQAEKVISVGYSLSGFLTPDLLMSLNRGKDVLAGLIANPPGVQAEPMKSILDKFKHSGEHMNEHLEHSRLKCMQPRSFTPFVDKLYQKAHKAQAIADVVWRPTNLSLWLAFSRGNLLERVQALHRLIPEAVINFAFGYEDPLCCPDVLTRFLLQSPYGATVVEHGDHAWGADLPRSMGHLVTKQIAEVLEMPRQPAGNLAMVA